MTNEELNQLEIMNSELQNIKRLVEARDTAFQEMLTCLNVIAMNQSMIPHSMRAKAMVSRVKEILSGKDAA